MTCRWYETNTEENRKSGFAGAYVAAVSHGTKSTQAVRGTRKEDSKKIPPRDANRQVLGLDFLSSNLGSVPH